MTETTVVAEAPPVRTAGIGPGQWWPAFGAAAWGEAKPFGNQWQDGGCGWFFLLATRDSLNPFTPSVTSVVEPAVGVWVAEQYAAPARYAAARANVLGGRGLLYPQNSTVWRAMMGQARTASSGAARATVPLTITVAIWEGLVRQQAAMLQGKCR